MTKQLHVIMCCLLTTMLSAQLEYKDVASVFYARCTSCHHNGASDYPFMNYAQTVAMTGAIQYNLVNGIMPPWSADTSYTRFQHERIITSSEKQKILSWISAGALKGDTTLAPVAPVYPTGYQLAGNADLTLSIGTFTSTATTTDKYNCFSMPTGLTQDRIIRAFEIVPGNAPIVHHAVVTADTTGTYASDLSGSCYSIPGNLGIGTYAPGAKATVFPGQLPLKAGIRLKAGSNIIIQMHNPAGSSGEVDSTKIRLYFYPVGTTGVREIISATPLQNWFMSIPANSIQAYSAYYPSASMGLPLAISAFAVMPHSHLICKSIIYYAINPGVDTIKLVKINDWNFEWQDYYTFNKLVKIPAGYRLYSKHVFDNTTNNPNNPNNPPINVYAGTGTHDEMLFDGIMALAYQTGDELIDIKGIMAGDPIYATSLQDQQTPKPLTSKVFPNPFKDAVFIQYGLYEDSQVTIEIKDVFGRTIQQFQTAKQSPGVYDWQWNGLDNQGIKVPSGMYFYQVKANGSVYENKLIRQD